MTRPKKLTTADLPKVPETQMTDYMGQSVYDHLPLEVAAVFEPNWQARCDRHAREYDGGTYDMCILNPKESYFTFLLPPDETFTVERSSNYFSSTNVSAEALSLMVMADLVCSCANYCHGKKLYEAGDWAAEWYHTILEHVRQHPDKKLRADVFGFLD